MLKQRKTLQESPMDFLDHFHLLQFEALKSQMKFQYLMDIFEYFLIKYVNPKMNLNFKPRSTYFTDEVVQS